MKKITSMFSAYVWAVKKVWRLKKSAVILWGGVSLVCAFLPIVILPLISRVVDNIDSSAGSGEPVGALILQISLLCALLASQGIYAVIPDISRFSILAHLTIPVQNEFMTLNETVPLQYLNDKEFAENMSEVGGHTSYVMHVVNNSVSALSALISIVGMLVVSISVSWLLLPILLVSIAVYGLFAAKERKLHDELYWGMKNQRRKKGYFEELLQQFAAIKEMRILRCSDFFLKKWSSAAKRLNDDEYALIRKQYTATVLTGTVDAVAQCLVLVVSYVLMFNGKITLGVMMMLWQLIPQTLSRSVGFSQSLSNILKQLIYIKNEKAFFDIEYDAEGLPKHNDDDVPVIDTDDTFSLENVSFSYKNDRKVLDGITLSIKKGEVVALCGVNGAGKSTLIKLLLGIYAPSSGRILFEGVPYGDLTRRHMAKKIGVVFQDYAQFELPVRDNIAFGDISRIRDDSALWEAARKSQAAEIIERLPFGMETVMGKKFMKDGVELSGGEEQRIMVARAHISDRDVLILDEPAAKVDPLAEIKQFEEIRRSISGRTAILVSHRMGFARLADRILVFDSGKIIEDGSHDELMQKNGLYAAMFRSQAEWYEREEEQV